MNFKQFISEQVDESTELINEEFTVTKEMEKELEKFKKLMKKSSDNLPMDIRSQGMAWIVWSLGNYGGTYVNNEKEYKTALKKHVGSNWP